MLDASNLSIQRQSWLGPGEVFSFRSRNRAAWKPRKRRAGASACLPLITPVGKLATLMRVGRCIERQSCSPKSYRTEPVCACNFGRAELFDQGSASKFSFRNAPTRQWGPNVVAGVIAKAHWALAVVPKAERIPI